MMSPRYRTPSKEKHAFTTIELWKRGGPDMFIPPPSPSPRPEKVKNNPAIRKIKNHSNLEEESIKLEERLQEELNQLHDRHEKTLQLKNNLEGKRMEVDIIREQLRKPQTREEYRDAVDDLEITIRQTWDEFKPAGGI